MRIRKTYGSRDVSGDPTDRVEIETELELSSLEHLLCHPARPYD